MSDEEGKMSWVEWRLNEIERKLGSEPPPRSARRTFEALDFSPRTILVAVTLANIALFIGGTVYTGVQVKSIQERYAEAAQKIAEAQLKYEQADLRLQSIQVVSDKAKEAIGSIQKQTSDLLTDFQKRAQDNGAEVASIKAQANQELDALKRTSSSIVATMTSYQKDTETALSKAANDVGIKLEREIQVNKESIDSKQASIDALGVKIEGLSADVKKKGLELAVVQKGLNDQLDEARKLDAELTNTIRTIARTDKITIPVAWTITDVWLKAVAGVTALLALIALVVAFRR